MAEPRNRNELSEILHEYCEHVYFQPPTGTELQYPCIIYRLETTNKRYANNGRYMYCAEYSLQYITSDPDDDVKFKIDQLQYCAMGRSFISDNLYHYNYRLFF